MVCAGDTGVKGRGVARNMRLLSQSTVKIHSSSIWQPCK